MANTTERVNLLAELVREIETVSIAWQLGVIALCLALAWITGRLLRPRLERTAAAAKADGGQDALFFGTAGLMRVLVPLVAWVLLILSRIALQPHQPVNLLNVAIPLSSSLVIIRVAFYVLRHALPPSGWLRQSERAIAWTVWIGMALHLTGLLPEIREFLDSLALTLGKQRVSLLNVIEGTISVAITLVGAMWAGRLIEGRLMALQHLDTSLRVVFSKLVKTVLLALAVLIALPLVGIDVTVLSVFGGALGVGLGFGLQKIAANYISGFAILLDRSIKLGDLVTVDGRYGTVARLTARYVVVREFDGTEAIIPNESVITSTVLNHSYSDQSVRVDLTVQVAYGTNLRQALDALQAIAREHPRVQKEPAPAALVRNFGESGIDLDLMVWISDPEAGRGNLRSELNLRIDEVFRQRGFEIPFPQRDLHIVSGALEPAAKGQV